MRLRIYAYIWIDRITWRIIYLMDKWEWHFTTDEEQEFLSDYRADQYNKWADKRDAWSKKKGRRLSPDGS